MKESNEPKQLTLLFLELFKFLEYLFYIVMSSGPYINPTNQAPWEQRPPGVVSANFNLWPQGHGWHDLHS